MSKIFILAMVAIGVVLAMTGVLFWSSTSNREDIIIQRDILATKTAEIRNDFAPDSADVVHIGSNVPLDTTGTSEP